MKRTIEAYLDAYVAARRLERHAARADQEWERWLGRVALAKRVGQHELAAAARAAALRAGATAAALHGAATAQWDEAVRREHDALKRS